LTLIPGPVFAVRGTKVSSMIRFATSLGNTDCTNGSKRTDNSAAETCARSISL
jgi:hypothetical protein